MQAVFRKKIFSRFFIVPTAFLLGMLLTGCQSDESEDFKNVVNCGLIKSLRLDPATPSPIGRDESQQFNAYLVKSNGSEENVTRSVLWTSSEQSLAQIDNNGLLTGLNTGDGTVIVTATYQACNSNDTVATASVELSGVLTSVDIKEKDSGATDNLQVSECKNLQLIAEGDYGASTTNRFRDITEKVSWSLNPADSAFATISDDPGSKGLLSTTNAANPGVTARAEYTEKQGVTPGQEVIEILDNLAGIALTPTSMNLGVAAQSEFLATGTYGGVDSADITANATWTSSADTVVSVSDVSGSKGSVTAKTIGSAVITAACGGQLATASVTVESAQETLRLDLDDDKVTDSQFKDGITVSVGKISKLELFAVAGDGSKRNITDDNDTSWKVVPNTGILTLSDISNKEIFVTAKKAGENANVVVTYEPSGSPQQYLSLQFIIRPN